MKLVTFTHASSTRAGVLTESGDIADLGAAMIELLADGTLLDRAKKALVGSATIPATEAAIEAPVPRPPKVLAIGLNYRDHAEESNQPIPQRPVVFAKMPTCITRPGTADLRTAGQPRGRLGGGALLRDWQDGALREGR